jgi:CRISPR-associated helicase Cas3
MVNVLPLNLPTIRDPEWKQVFGHHPHPFQSRIVHTIERMRQDGGGVILFHLPTGVGKTRGLISHALLKRQNAILVYPNNALRADQARQIRENVCRNGNSHQVREIDAYHLRAYMQEAETRHYARKGRALFELLSSGLGPFKENVIALTNPDMFALLMHGRPAMHQMSLQEICRAYPVIGFDEVHTYDLKQLSSLIHIARVLVEQIPFVFIFSSATISPDLESMLKTFPAFEIEDAEKQWKIRDQRGEWRELVPTDIVEERLILSPLELTVSPVADWQGGRWVQQEDNLRKIRLMAADGGCVLIFDSVPESLSVYTALSDLEGSQRVGLVIGAVDQRDRPDQMARNIVVGNNAIRVGIDFSRENVKRNAIVYARSASDAIQGLGRIGRGEEKGAYANLLTQPFTAELLDLDYPAKGISRSELVQLLAGAFPSYQTFKNYLGRWAHLEAQHMQEATGLWNPQVIRELFGPSDSRLDYEEFKRKHLEMLDDLTFFRASEPFSIAVLDDLFRSKGLFEFYTSDIYRILRWGTVQPIGWKEYEEAVRTRSGSSGQGEIFLYSLEEGKNRGDVVGCCRVTSWQARPYRIYFTNDLIADPRQNQNLLSNGVGWEFVCRDDLPPYIKAVYTHVCQAMREQQVTYIIFNPDEHRFPPLFKSYPVSTQQRGNRLAVAFGHNAFLIDSLVCGDPAYIV